MKNSAGFCRCGRRLPSVRDYETPPEFCSLYCKRQARQADSRAEDVIAVISFLMVVMGVWAAWRIGK